MDQPTTIGLDLAKSVFQVHGVSADGTAVLRRQLRRGQVLAFFSRLEPCLIGIEACSGAHHWARELAALGHEVRLMPFIATIDRFTLEPYVKPYVKRGKTDRADAEVICEAVTRPTMRFVPVKSADAQAALLDHRARDFLIRQQTQTVNTIRAHLAEFGIVIAKGIHNIDRLLEAVEHASEAARPAIDFLADQLRDLRERIETVTKRIEAARDRRTRSHAVSPRSPVSARSPPAPSPSPRPTLPRFARRGTTRHGSASRRSRTRAAVRSDWAGSQRPATGTCGPPLPRSHGEPSRRHAFETDGERSRRAAADARGPTGCGRCWSGSP